MRKPLSPLQAFAEDARTGIERAFDDSEALVSWLSLAQAADSLIDLRGDDRAVAMNHARQLLSPFATERPTMVHDAKPAPTDEIGIVAEQFRVAAEAMENAGCFELAYSTVSAVCRLTVGSDYATAALATTHLGRIARQMNDLSTAEDCYTSMLQTSTRKRDGPLAARGHIGLALIYDMRGNLPAAETEYLKALDLAVHNSAGYASACQGLMSLAMAGNRLADALIYGWRGYDASVPGSAVQSEFVVDMSVIAMRAGFHEAALNGFEQVLLVPRVPRVQAMTLSGAIRAAALLGDRARVTRYDEEILQALGRANLSMTASFVLICSAEAWLSLSEFQTARERAQQASEVAGKYRHTEYQFKSESLLESISVAERVRTANVQRPTEAWSSDVDADRSIGIGIRRLQTLGA